MVDSDWQDDGDPEGEDQLKNPVILRHRRSLSRRHPRLEFLEPVPHHHRLLFGSRDDRHDDPAVRGDGMVQRPLLACPSQVATLRQRLRTIDIEDPILGDVDLPSLALLFVC